MSIADAIMELAAAMREQAAAQREANDVSRQTAAGYERAVTAYATASTPADVVEQTKALVKQQSAERDPDQQARGVSPDVVNKATEILKEVVADPELEAAVSKVEESAAEEAKELDYKTDVRPVLLNLAKAKGQPALKELLAKYGAPNGDKLNASDYAGIVADANNLIAG